MPGELHFHIPLCDDSDHCRPAMLEQGGYLIGALLTKAVAIVTLSGGFQFEPLAWIRVLPDEASDGHV